MKVVLENLTKIFPGRGKNAQQVIAVNNFNFEIPDGKLIGLLGPSGCGKSTALNLISGLLSPTSGRILFDDEDVKAALEDGSYYMDMSAEADEGLVHIKAVIENIGVIYGITMDESGYIDAALENNDLNAMFTAMGMENVKMEKNEVELAGAAHAGLRIEAEYQGVSIYQQVVAVKKNSYVMTVICACRDEDILSTMLGYFYALD